MAWVDLFEVFLQYDKLVFLYILLVYVSVSYGLHSYPFDRIFAAM